MTADLHVATDFINPPAPTPPAPLAEPGVREALRIAIEAQTTAAARRDKIRASCERAEDMLADAKAELGEHDDLDEKIAQARADAIAASLASGKDADLSTPKELAKLSKRRTETNNKVRAIETALAQLRRDLDEAEEEWFAADQATRAATLPLLALEAEAMSADLFEHEARAAALRKRLAGYRQLQRSYLGFDPAPPNSWLPLSQATRAKLNQSPPNFGISGDGPPVALWRESFHLLMGDADAPLDALRP